MRSARASKQPKRTSFSFRWHVPRSRTKAEFSATKVRLIPAAPGTGVIAGRGVRPVVEAAGIKDLLSKRYGSNNPVNVVKATFEALRQMKSIDTTAKERGLTRHELRQRRMVKSAVKQES
jgi:small subunit ribosomal protein S5